MNNFVILIAGVPGTGKTTISKILSKKISAKHIELSKFAVEHDLILETDEERKTEVINLIELKNMIFDKIKKNDSTFIIDGHYSYDVVNPSFITHLFILRKAPWKLFIELSSREYHKDKIWENVEAEIMNVCMNEAQEIHDPKKIFEINTTDLKAEETVIKICNIIHNENYNNKTQIDWLNYPETMKLLEEKYCI